MHGALLAQPAQTHGAQNFIEFCPAAPYRDALADTMAVDVLLVMQASNCSTQILAKFYDYLRAGVNSLTQVTVSYKRCLIQTSSVPLRARSGRKNLPSC